MEKPVLRRINILIYPFNGLTNLLETPAGKAKLGQWIKQIEYAGKNKDSAFIIVHDSFSKQDPSRVQFDKFLEAQLGKRFITLKLGALGMSKGRLTGFFKMLD